MSSFPQKNLLPVFKDQLLLDRALTHRSALNESVSPSEKSNERLEFLGDAVLELVTTEYLFTHFPDLKEGVLSSYRSALVKTDSLAQVARSLGLGELLFMSKGEEAGGGRENDSLLENTFEAIIGALYIDQGYAAARQFISEHLFPTLEEIVAKKLYKDPKSHLQELIQSQGNPAPDYTIIAEEGPDHSKEFTATVTINQTVVGSGSGFTKQTAERAAAEQALIELERD